MIVMIDNYDSFTYNLVQYLKILGADVRVFRNDAVSILELEKLDPAGFVISPGPGRPEAAGISVELIRHFSGRKPILGVCLGHQAIAEAYGGRIVRAVRPLHGTATWIEREAGVAAPAVRARDRSSRRVELVHGRLSGQGTVRRQARASHRVGAFREPGAVNRGGLPRCAQHRSQPRFPGT